MTKNSKTPKSVLDLISTLEARIQQQNSEINSLCRKNNDANNRIFLLEKENKELSTTIGFQRETINSHISEIQKSKDSTRLSCVFVVKCSVVGGSGVYHQKLYAFASMNLATAWVDEQYGAANVSYIHQYSDYKYAQIRGTLGCSALVVIEKLQLRY